jgi:hypothetical protein
LSVALARDPDFLTTDDAIELPNSFHLPLLSHYGNTPNKDALHRTTQDLPANAHTDSETILPPAQSGGIGRARPEGEQLGYAPGIAGVC